MNTLAVKVLIVLACVVGLAACTTEAPPPPSNGAEAAGAAAPTNRVDIPVAVRRNLGMTFASVELRDVERTIRMPGAFELLPRARRQYRMAFAGNVQLLVRQYQPVLAGDLLFRFRSPAWAEIRHEIVQADQAVRLAEAERKVAVAKITEAEDTRDALRTRLAALAAASLKRADLESDLALIEASVTRLRAERELAQTRLSNAKTVMQHAFHLASAATGLSESMLSSEVMLGETMVPHYTTVNWIEVRAGEAGIVDTLRATDGAYLDTGAVVVTTVDPAKIRFRASALQADLSRLQGRTEARIVPPLTPGVPADERVAAALTIGLEASPDDRTIDLLAEPRERRVWMVPGVSAFLEVVVEGADGPALAVPQGAVVRDGLAHVFFLRDAADPDKAIRIEADLGPSDGRWIVLKSDVMLGDEVVVDGAYELRLATAMSGTVQKGGHFHADGTWHDEAH